MFLSCTLCTILSNICISLVISNNSISSDTLRIFFTSSLPSRHFPEPYDALVPASMDSDPLDP